MARLPAKPKNFISECNRVLKKGGVLILSSPNKIVTSPGLDRPKNKFHFNEWDPHSIKRIVDKKFHVSDLYGQNLSTEIPSSNKADLKMNVLGKVAELIPGIVAKLIKKYILNYKETQASSIKILKTHTISEAKIDEFFYTNRKRAYAIFIFVLKKIE